VKTVEDAKQVMSITGGVQLELDCFLRIDQAMSLNEMIANYAFNFTNDDDITDIQFRHFADGSKS
jgi:hypothetical protein